MPLKLYPPDARNPNWRVRGQHNGVKIDRSTGVRTKPLAEECLKRWKREIERGAYAPALEAAAAAQEAKAEETVKFPAAALSYMQATGKTQYVAPLLEHFRDKPLVSFTQADIDNAAAVLYPDAAPATRNRQVYTPLSAILHHAGVPYVKTPDGGHAKIRRPSGGQGTARTTWLSLDDAKRLFDAAYGRADRLEREIDAKVALHRTHLQPGIRWNLVREARTARRFATFCLFLLYTGARLSEALRMTPDDIELEHAFVHCGKTKNGLPRAIHLPPDLVVELSRISLGEQQVFNISGKCGRLYTWLKEVFHLAGLPMPERVKFHIFRHTYGAWMRRYGGVDTSGLVATGAWLSRTSAAIYEHVVPTEEARKADHLPRVLPARSTGNFGGFLVDDRKRAKS